MGKIADRFRATLDELIVEERTAARRQGEFLDTVVRATVALDEVFNPKSFALLPGTKFVPLGRSRGLTKDWLKRLMRAHNLAGRTRAGKLSLDDLIAWISERGLEVHVLYAQAQAMTPPTPTKDQLVAFWQSHGSPVLN